MNELFKIIFGDFTVIQLLGYIWFILIGYILSTLLEVTGRNKKSKNTPKKWNWRFWFHDNWKRYIATVLCTYILFRFYNEFSGHDFGNFDGIILGLLGNNAAAEIRNRVKSLGKDKDRRAFMAKMRKETENQ